MDFLRGPHIEWFSTEAYGGYEEQLDFLGDGKAAISLTALLMNQYSRGTVRLSLYHPLAPPLIDHASLSEPLDPHPTTREGWREWVVSLTHYNDFFYMYTRS